MRGHAAIPTVAVGIPGRELVPLAAARVLGDQYPRRVRRDVDAPAGPVAFQHLLALVSEIKDAQRLLVVELRPALRPPRREELIVRRQGCHGETAWARARNVDHGLLSVFLPG